MYQKPSKIEPKLIQNRPQIDQKSKKNVQQANLSPREAQETKKNTQERTRSEKNAKKWKKL